MPEETGEKQGERNEKGQFVPGVSGNPNGRPNGVRNFTTKVREALEKIAEGESFTNEEAFIKAILKKAIIDQDVGMMKTVWEQLDGKPLQRVANADGSNLNPIPILPLSNVLPNNSNDQSNGDETTP